MRWDNTVKQLVFRGHVFLRLGNFAVPRIFIFTDASMEHSSFIVLLSHFSYFYWATVRKSIRPRSHFLSISITEYIGNCTTGQEWSNGSLVFRVDMSSLAFLGFSAFSEAVTYFHGLDADQESCENNMSAEKNCFTVAASLVQFCPYFLFHIVENHMIF